MKNSELVLWLAIGATLPALATAGCTYSPSFRNGALACSDNRECPRGYSCSTSNTCCLSGDPTCGGTIGGIDAGPGDTGFHLDSRPDLLGTGGVTSAGGKGGQTVGGTGGTAGAVGTGGGSGTGGNKSTNVSDYVGVWTFAAPASVVTVCDDPKSASGTTLFPTKPGDSNYPSTILVQDNGDGTLYAEWSEWPNCSYTLTLDGLGAHGSDSLTWSCADTTGDPQEFWSYNSFDLVTANGKTGTHDGVYVREDDWSDGTIVFCQQTVHAALTKN